MEWSECAGSYDFSEAILSGLRWDLPRNDLILTVLYGAAAPQGLADADIDVRFVDCFRAQLHLAQNIENAKSFGIQTPWQEIEEFLVEKQEGGYHARLSTNIVRDLLVVDCREICIEAEASKEGKTCHPH